MRIGDLHGFTKNGKRLQNPCWFHDFHEVKLYYSISWRSSESMSWEIRQNPGGFSPVVFPSKHPWDVNLTSLESVWRGQGPFPPLVNHYPS